MNPEKFIYYYWCGVKSDRTLIFSSHFINHFKKRNLDKTHGTHRFRDEKETVTG